MPQIKGWFKARKTLHNRLHNRRQVYYENVYGHRNLEEELEGVHILNSESGSESELSRRQATARKGVNVRGSARTLGSNNDNEPVIPAAERAKVIMIDDSDVDDTFIADLRKHAAQSVNDRNVRAHSWDPSQGSDYEDSDEEATHPEPREASSFQKHKRFGLFAASATADAEPVAERYMEPPQRSSIKTRRIEREQKKSPEKKGRYDLRPRRTLAGDHGEGPLVAELSGADEPDAEDESEDEELKRPRSVTRSMRKPIPRSRAARKTAWAAMGLA